MEYSSQIPVSKCPFTFEHYSYLIKTAKDKGYEFITMEDFADGKRADRFLLIRHDVDFEPAAALNFAKIEHEYGARATYFIRVHANNYNPFGFKTYYTIKKILELGHNIGLHYEHLDLSSITGDDPVEIIKREKKLLELIFGKEIKGLSPHRDFTPIMNRDFWKEHDIKDFGFTYEAYMEMFFDGILYLSDSLGKWGGNGKCLCNYLGEEERIYILVHPSQWYHRSYHLEVDYHGDIHALEGI